MATLTLVLPVGEKCENSYSSTRERKITTGTAIVDPGETGKGYENGRAPEEPLYLVQRNAETRCAWCEEERSRCSALRGLTNHATAWARTNLPANIGAALLSPQALQQWTFGAVFAVQCNSKNITFNVSKIHYKTIKGGTSLQCIVTSIKIVVTLLARGLHLHQLFECQKSNLWLLKRLSCPPRFIFLNGIHFAILKDAIYVFFRVLLPHCIFRSVLSPLFLKH